jgi:hypothetical protein
VKESNIGQMDGDLQNWHDAKTFADMLSLNRMYLKGNIKGHPYHAGYLEEETYPLVSRLLTLNDFGMLTYYSKPFKLSTGPTEEFWQKPLVSFAIDNLVLLEFVISKLIDDPEVIISVDQVHPFKVIVRIKRQNVSQWRYLGSNWNNLVTISNGDQSNTHMFNLPAIVKTRLWTMDVTATKWGADIDVFKRLASLSFYSGQSPRLIDGVPEDISDSERPSLEALPAELFSMIASNLELRDLAQLLQCSKATFDLTKYTYRKRYQTVGVILSGSGPTPPLREFLENELSESTQRFVLIQQKHYKHINKLIREREQRESWAKESLTSLRQMLEVWSKSKEGAIAVTYRCADVDMSVFLRSFDGYQGLMGLESIFPIYLKHLDTQDQDRLKSIHSLELLEHDPSELLGFAETALDAWASPCTVTLPNGKLVKKRLSIISCGMCPKLEEFLQRLGKVVEVSITDTGGKTDLSKVVYEGPRSTVDILRHYGLSVPARNLLEICHYYIKTGSTRLKRCWVGRGSDRVLMF